MAVKYVRKGYRKGKTGVFGKATPVVADLKKTKQRLLFVYMGVAVLAALSLIFQILEAGGPSTEFSVKHGEARIVAKPVVEEETGEKRFFLDLRVQWVVPNSSHPDSGEGTAQFLDERIEVSEALWNGFSEGEMIPVLYQIDSVRERLSVQTILPEGPSQGDE